MRFTDFLRTTVLISAAAASALGVVTLAGADGGERRPGRPGRRGLVGGGRGHRRLARPARETSQPIASLLASARTQTTLPELNPAATVLNRLWPLLCSTIGAGALAFVLPQVPAVAAGVRDHLGAGLAPAGIGGDGDRGARRRALLHRAQLAAASRSSWSARRASAPTCSR